MLPAGSILQQNLTRPTFSRRGVVLAVAGIVVSAIAVGLVVRGIDLTSTASALGSADPGWVGVAVALVVVQVCIRAARWRELLPRVHTSAPPIIRVVPVTFVGYLANTILPARAGEAVRAVLIARRERLPAPETIGSVISERLVDTLILGVIGAVAALVLGAPEWVVRTGLIAVALAVVASLVATMVGRMGDRHWHSRLPLPILRLLEVGLRVARGSGAARSRRTMVVVVGLSVVSWGLDGAVYWSVARAVGLEIAPVGALIVSAVVALSTAIPSAPGYIGTFELAAVAALGVLGVAAAPALAVALLSHVAAIVPIAAGGIVSFWWLRGTSAVDRGESLAGA